jgi:hypothetical protein
MDSFADAERTNEHRRAQHGGPASAQGAVEHDGQGFVGDDIAEEQRDEHPVLAALQKPQHTRGILALGGLARVRQNLEVDFVLPHETACGQRVFAGGAMLTYAMVKPANTPPARTSAIAMQKYKIRLASSSAGSSLWRALTTPPNGKGIALTMGTRAWKT